MSPRTRTTVAVLALLAILLVGTSIEWDLAAFRSLAERRPVAAAGAYVLILAASIVLLPLSSLPFLPLAANLWGVFLGSILSILGWWIGAMIAFLLARHLGRPVLERFVSMEKLDSWERTIPRDATFLGIALLRMVTPVDLPSYALGLLRPLSFGTYALATLAGITPFAFVWAGIGAAVLDGDFGAAVLFFIAMALGVLFLRRVMRLRSGSR